MKRSIALLALIIASTSLPMAVLGSQETLPPRMDAPDTRPPSAQIPPHEANVPVPESRPPAPAVPEEAWPGAAPEVLGRPALVPLDERFCRVRINQMGIRYTAVGAIASESGCRIDHPLSVETLGTSVELKPGALLNCAMTAAAAGFISEVASPLAEEMFGQPIAVISNVSAYVCRPRNGTEKLSEHAFGNALDIAAFVLKDGTTIEVREHGDDNPRADRFLDTFRERACGPFLTVLGPGSDADHADHVHLDLAQRRGGSTFCQ